MGRRTGNSKLDCHKTERFLRRITMLMRLQRIKARMATSSNNSTSSSQQRPPQRHPSEHISTRDRQRLAPPSSPSQRPSEVPVSSSLSLSTALQRSGRTSIVLHPDRQQRSEASSKRSHRFSHRRRQSEQLRRQLERLASSEQQQPTARVRVVAVVLVPHHSGRRQSSSGSSRSSNSRRRMRRALARELRMGSGRPHVLNLVRRLLGRVESMAAVPEEDTDANGGRILLPQAQNERTPEKGNQSGEGDDQQTG